MGASCWFQAAVPGPGPVFESDSLSEVTDCSRCRSPESVSGASAQEARLVLAFGNDDLAPVDALVLGVRNAAADKTEDPRLSGACCLGGKTDDAEEK